MNHRAEAPPPRRSRASIEEARSDLRPLRCLCVRRLRGPDDVGALVRLDGPRTRDDLRDELHGARRALQRRKARRATERDLRREAELEVE